MRKKFSSCNFANGAVGKIHVKTWKLDERISFHRNKSEKNTELVPYLNSHENFVYCIKPSQESYYKTRYKNEISPDREKKRKNLCITSKHENV